MIEFIKDTSLWESYRLTVELADEAPEITGHDSITLDVVPFRPHSVELCWLRKDGEPWKLQTVELRDRRVFGTNSRFRKVAPKDLALIPGLPELVGEVAPKQ